MCQIPSLMASAEGPVAEFSSFANFEEKKGKSNLLMSFPKTGNQMGSFGQIKKIVIPLLSADSRYFRTYALNNTNMKNSRGENAGRCFLKSFFSHSRKLFSECPHTIFAIASHDIIGLQNFSLSFCQI